MRPRRKTAPVLSATLAAAALTAVSYASAAGLYGAEGVAEELIARLPLEDRLTTLAFTARGDRAAMALDVTGSDPKARRSKTLLRVTAAAGAEPKVLELQGLNRDLLFSSDERSLFVLQHLPDWRGPSRTELIEVDAERLDPRRTLHVALTARSLASWPARKLLLVIGDDEIRSHHEGNLHSGPVYRIPGANRSAVPLDGARLLLGRELSLALVNLDDPPRDRATPVREETAAPSVVQLVATAAPPRVLARSSEGVVFEVGLAPLEAGRVLGTGLLARRTASVPAAATPAPATDVDERPEAAATTEEPLPPAPSRPSATAPASADVEVSVEATPPARTEVPAPAATPDVQLAGALSGEGADAVVAVVLFGPDNLLREAARVAPEGGRWSVQGLAPGRYRIQLDGGARVVSSRPQFHSVSIERSAAPILVEFEVLGSR